MFDGENDGIMNDILTNDVSGNMSHGHRRMSSDMGSGSSARSDDCSEEDDEEYGKEEEDFQKVLTDINNEAIQELKNDDTKAALDCLQKGEQMLELIATEGREIDRNLIIVILYNQACCY